MLTKEFTKYSLTLLMTLIISSIGLSQCEFEPSEKVTKLLEKSADKKKYDSEKRNDFLIDALDEDDKCWPCMHRLGVLNFKRSKRSGSSFGNAQSMLNQLTEACPEYHSDPLYYLGAISYAERDYEAALDYFDRFIHFPDDDPSAFAKDYDKKYDEVQETLPDIRFWKEFYESDMELDPTRVDGVSSTSDEYLPAISPDGEIMFYTRKFMKKAKGDLYSTQVEEFTESHRDDINALFDEGRALPAPFNVNAKYGGATISVDNKEMYIAASNPAQGNPGNIDLYKTTYKLAYDEVKQKNVYTWTELESLGDHINTEMGWEAQPSLSGDGQLLFFTKVGPECMTTVNGDFSHDIFVCKRQEDGSWSAPKSAGNTINTTGHEKTPFMHSDSKTLYFASSGLRGKGGMDIFYCKMDDQGVFGKAKNIGHPVNSTEDETGLIVSADGEAAYFASQRIKGGKGYDVYSFQLPEKAKPEKVMVLKGVAQNDDGDPAPEARIQLTYAQSKEVQEIKVNEEDGRYATIVNLERGEDVVMSVVGKDIAFNSRIVADKDDLEPPAVVKLEVKTQVLSTNTPFLINDIYYSTNSADIDRASKIILDQFALYLADNPSLFIEIRGHTDDVGSEGDNLALSMDRAFEVKGYLERQGVPGKRITAQGFGESKPLDYLDLESIRAKNRRTEFVIKKM